MKQMKLQLLLPFAIAIFFQTAHSSKMMDMMSSMMGMGGGGGGGGKGGEIMVMGADGQMIR